MQLLRVMSDLWKKEDLDMQMQLYDCISTGNERGLLQIVDNANTIGMCYCFSLEDLRISILC